MKATILITLATFTVIAAAIAEPVHARRVRKHRPDLVGRVTIADSSKAAAAAAAVNPDPFIVTVPEETQDAGLLGWRSVYCEPGNWTFESSGAEWEVVTSPQHTVLSDTRFVNATHSAVIRVNVAEWITLVPR